ncbi:MAG: flagellar biosynthetic protein FliQ [Rhodocyclaceae bacterium]
MSPDLALRLASHLLWSGLVMAAPILAIILIVGVSISVLQVITQIQDMSLTFIPKLVCVAIGIGVFGPWMLRQLTSFVVSLWSSLATLA